LGNRPRTSETEVNSGYSSGFLSTLKNSERIKAMMTCDTSLSVSFDGTMSC
jgi:hypothetical protein